MPRRDDDDFDEPPTPYRMRQEAEPRKKCYRPMKGFKSSMEREPDPFDKPVLARFLGIDPFPWMLAGSVFLWGSLGFLCKQYAFAPALLMMAGAGVIMMSGIWAALSIIKDDLITGIIWLVLSVNFFVCVFFNPDVMWRPLALTVIGLLMLMSGCVAAAS